MGVVASLRVDNVHCVWIAKSAKSGHTHLLSDCIWRCLIFHCPITHYIPAFGGACVCPFAALISSAAMPFSNAWFEAWHGSTSWAEGM